MRTTADHASAFACPSRTENRLFAKQLLCHNRANGREVVPILVAFAKNDAPGSYSSRLILLPVRTLKICIGRDRQLPKPRRGNVSSITTALVSSQMSVLGQVDPLETHVRSTEKADTNRRLSVRSRFRHFSNGTSLARGRPENKSALYPYPSVRPVRATRSERNS